MNLPTSLMLDIIILTIILFRLFTGWKKGAVSMLSGLASLGCGLTVGSLLRDTFAVWLGNSWLTPAVQTLLLRAKDALAVSDLAENLSAILREVQLPAFLKTDVVERAAERMLDNGVSALSGAAAVIGERLAGWLLFLVGTAVGYLLVRLLFRLVLNPLVSHLPLIRGANRLLGTALGGLLGILTAGLVLWLAYWLLPGLSANAGKLLSAESVSGSLLARQYFRLFPGIFGS